jgi:GNAT superfamily N-acetyltransferase
MTAAYRILLARTEHLSVLPEIERSAAALFPAEVLPQELRMETTSIDAFETARQGGMLWVAIAINDNPVGFALAKDHGITLHLEELDVHPDHQRLGIGRALMGAISQSALEAGYQGITLTTFLNIPWNAPWYESLGFRVLKTAELSPELREILQTEAQRGLDPKLRVAMLKSF